MLGAVLGDIAGSIYEFGNNREAPRVLFTEENFPTDDTYLSCAVADALEQWKNGADLESAVYANTLSMVVAHPNAGWGVRFSHWASKEGRLSDWMLNEVKAGRKVTFTKGTSAGNGCAMKISAVPYYVTSLKECKEVTRRITSVTHDHEDSYKAAECLTSSMWLALEGKTRDQVRQNILDHYPEVADMSYEKLNKEYRYTEMAKDTVPQAMVCFLESTDFEDALRKAISIGGDADTLAAITGALAEAFYGWTSRKFYRYTDMIDDYGMYTVPSKSIFRVIERYAGKNPDFYKRRE